MVALHQVAHQKVFGTQKYQMASLVIAPNSKSENRMELELAPQADSFLEPNVIKCFAGGSEMLRVGPDGFWVRGVKVEQDEHEAQAVYEAFKQWMSWNYLERA